MAGDAAPDRRGAARRPTMQDVADEAGVSKGLVSMVLSGSSGPSAVTRERVLAVATRLGYRGDRTAALLARRRTRTLGVTFIPGNLYHGELVEEIRGAAEAASYELVLSSTAGVHDEAHAIETLVDSRCEALLLLGPTLPADRLAAVVEPVPTVVVGRPLDLPRADVVRADDVDGVAQAVEHLVGLGHRRIAHVDGGEGAIAQVRRDAYLGAMRRAWARGRRRARWPHRGRRGRRRGACSRRRHRSGRLQRPDGHRRPRPAGALRRPGAGRDVADGVRRQPARPARADRPHQRGAGVPRAGPGGRAARPRASRGRPHGSDPRSSSRPGSSSAGAPGRCLRISTASGGRGRARSPGSTPRCVPGGAAGCAARPGRGPAR